MGIVKLDQARASRYCGAGDTTMVDRTAVGTSYVRSAYLHALRDAWTNKRLVLFLGAGVSTGYGIPGWRDLVLDLLLASGDRRFDRFPPHFRPALASWLADRFDFSPTLLARVVKYQIAKTAGGRDKRTRFLEAVRERLYANLKPALRPGSALRSIADLIHLSERQGRRIQAVVTFNFDGLLETQLTRRTVKVEVVCGRRRHPRKFPVVHVHGYVPKTGAATKRLVFTEDDYNRLTLTSFDWSVTEIVHYLRNSTVLFIGLSMTDPNLRRLIDATHAGSRGIRHFAIRREYHLEQKEWQEAVAEVRRRAETALKKMHIKLDERPKFESGPVDVEPALHKMLKQAHTYDRRLFKDMGVGVVWLNSFDDLPELLEAVSSGGGTRRASPRTR